jgi:hypothetical protein
MFVTDVLGLNIFGSEYHNDLDDFEVELYTNGFKYTTPVLLPDPQSDDFECRQNKHIIN